MKERYTVTCVITRTCPKGGPDTRLVDKVDQLREGQAPSTNNFGRGGGTFRSISARAYCHLYVSSDPSWRFVFLDVGNDVLPLPIKYALSIEA